MRNETYDPREVCEQRLAQFIERFGVRKFRPSYTSLLNLLRQGGLSLGDVSKHLHDYWYVDPSNRVLCDYARGGPFDHVELWGRDGMPLFLVGHPYDISKEATGTLDGIRCLGMTVVVDFNNWYGTGTMHVRVYHPDTVAAHAGPGVWRIDQSQASGFAGPSVSVRPNADGIGHP